MEEVLIPENLAADYFTLSLNSFLACGDPERADQFEGNLRQAVLFGAFATEAYVNAFIGLACPEQAQSLDRVPTLDTLLLATRLTLGRDVFDRGAEPFQGLTALFKRRNELVHHKPGVVRREREKETGLLKPRDNPKQVGRCLLAVAKATYMLDGCLDELEIMSPWEVAWDLGDEIDLADVPQRDIETWFVGEPVLVVIEESSYLQNFSKELETGPPRPGNPPLGTCLLSGAPRRRSGSRR